MEWQLKMKIVLLGESGVGKTCIIERYVSNIFKLTLPTRQSGHKNFSLTSPNGRITVSQAIWDTAGQEAYRSLAPFFYRDADAVIIVYDTTNLESFKAMDYWIKEVKENTKDEVLFTVAANKSDLIDQQKVDYSEGEAFAKQHNAGFFLVSAKDSINVSEMFVDLVVRKFPHVKKDFGCDEEDGCVDNGVVKEKSKGQDKVSLKRDHKDGKKKCC
eukprot:TRINITY_DN12857_c0_g3_i1.p1 TRINITY_DN12857_c0_g3~~TRINITY_DN12857_c0_g3_i1.p1  ORF type:complete len:247 (-),score=84.28 TRINITY_DN12857_c0_g3_i1:149-793(-)